MITFNLEIPICLTLMRKFKKITMKKRQNQNNLKPSHVTILVLKLPTLFKELFKETVSDQPLVKNLWLNLVFQNLNYP